MREADLAGEMRSGGRSFGERLASIDAWAKTERGRRLVRSFLWSSGLYLALVLLLAFWGPDGSWVSVSASKKEKKQAAGLVVDIVLLVWLVASSLLAARYKAKFVRLDRRLAEKHTAFYRSRLEREFAQKEMQLFAERAAWERGRDEWQAQKQSELYSMILDQVHRGTLGPRPKLRDDD